MKLAILFTHWFFPPFLSLWRFQTFSLKKSFPKHARDNKISSPKEQKHKKRLNRDNECNLLNWICVISYKSRDLSCRSIRISPNPIKQVFPFVFIIAGFLLRCLQETKLSPIYIKLIYEVPCYNSRLDHTLWSLVNCLLPDFTPGFSFDN